MELTDKLEILADAARYDASCASSGAPRRDSTGEARRQMNLRPELQAA
jgi:predicted DNA-binding helix-hairpin-helix protein